LQDANEFHDLDDAYDVITMTDEDGAEREFAVLEAVQYGAHTYLLVAEDDFADTDADGEAVILKEIKQDGEEVVYEIVEDDAEFANVSVLFASEGDDYDIEL